MQSVPISNTMMDPCDRPFVDHHTALSGTSSVTNMSRQKLMSSCWGPALDLQYPAAAVCLFSSCPALPLTSRHRSMSFKMTCAPREVAG